MDKIIALTIPKRVNRCWTFLGYNMARGVPPEKITYWLGETPIAYRNDYTAIADAAEADGFAFVRCFQGYDNIKAIRQHPAQMCQLWSYAQMLRYVVESGETCLFLWDDRFIGVPYGLLETITDTMAEAGEFYLFQLRLRGLASEPDLQKKRTADSKNASENSESIDVYRDMFNAFASTMDMPVDYKACYTQKGLHGYDESIVWTPDGAAWALECLNKLQDVPPDIKKLSYFELSEAHLPYYARCINLDNFLHFHLSAEAKTVIQAGGGIYCPRKIGFNFIDEPLALGSDTEYLTEHTQEFYHAYANETDLIFLNR